MIKGCDLTVGCGGSEGDQPTIAKQIRALNTQLALVSRATFSIRTAWCSAHSIFSSASNFCARSLEASACVNSIKLSTVTVEYSNRGTPTTTTPTTKISTARVVYHAPPPPKPWQWPWLPPAWLSSLTLSTGVPSLQREVAPTVTIKKAHVREYISHSKQNSERGWSSMGCVAGSVAMHAQHKVTHLHFQLLHVLVTFGGICFCFLHLILKKYQVGR